MNNLPELRKIIADAPEGSNEIDDTGRYWIYKGDGDYLLWDGREWIENWSPLHTRSLADIRTIVEQAERIAKLEQELNNMNHLLDNYDFVNALNGKEHEIRDLEQQAKGLEDYAKESCVGIDGVWMIAKASKLREKAKQLKGGAG